MRRALHSAPARVDCSSNQTHRHISWEGHASKHQIVLTDQALTAAMCFQVIRHSGPHLTGYPSLLGAKTVTCDVYILVRPSRKCTACTGQASHLLGGYWQPSFRLLVRARSRGMLAFKLASAKHSTHKGFMPSQPHATIGLTVRCRGRLHHCALRQRQAGAPELGR